MRSQRILVSRPIGVGPVCQDLHVSEIGVEASVGTVRDRLSAFAEWRTLTLKGDEKGEAQIFLDRFFRALGWDGVIEAGAVLEERLGNDNGGTSFADLVWKPRVIIEMKKAGADLSKHYRQAFNYWTHAVPNRPRYVVLCNFDEFWIYDFDNQVDLPVEKIGLTELGERWEAFGYLLPSPVSPIFGNDHVAVTRDAAKKVARVLLSLKARDVELEVAQRFVLQVVMAMFAEDVGLLPEHSFTKAIHDASTGAEAYDLIGGLFRAMATEGRTEGGRFKGTPYFNGGLFERIASIELTDDELTLLRDAAETNWSTVRPEIFGTLFEGSMNAGERHATGAHFTSQADIARVVNPVVVAPWQSRVESASTIPALNKVLEDMSQYRVFDPSCGSGNFLYVAYREMRRLERDAIDKIRELRRSQHLAGQESFGYVAPEQFFGMDINAFAVEIAKVTMMLGKKLADDELHEVGETLPLNNLDKNFTAADALFSPWPSCDAIVGNPPYLGRRKMVNELGVAYNARLNEKFGPKGVSDFVTYWIPLAHDRLPIGGRAGFVATKSIKQGDGRKASLDYVTSHDGVIFNAVSMMPWSGEANVTVSIVNWQKAGTPPKERILWLDVDQPPLVLDEITAALSPEINLKEARDLRVNSKGVYQGQTVGMKKAYQLKPFAANKLAQGSGSPRDVIHPLLDGREMLHATSIDDWIIDIATKDSGVAYRDYPGVMAYLDKAALPTHQLKADEQAAKNAEVLAVNPKAKLNKHHETHLDAWWQLRWRRDEYLRAVAGMDRYLALVRTSSEKRGPVFAFVDGAIHLSDSFVAFPFDDDYSYGILQSVVHETWFRERCSTQETRLRYTLSTVFRSFPWPQSPSAMKTQAVATAAANLITHIGEQFRLGTPLGDQWDVLRKPGKSMLKELKASLDVAVMDAYAFDPAEDLLTQIFELNLLVATKEAEGEPVTGPGPISNAATNSTWRFPAPVLPASASKAT